MSERARALEQARETALRTDATYLSPSGRIVRVQGHRLTGQILVDSRGRVAVRNIDTDRLSYVHESDLRELAVDPPPSGAGPQAEELRAANVANLREMVGMAGRHRETLLAVRECILALARAAEATQHRQDRRRWAESLKEQHQRHVIESDALRKVLAAWEITANERSARLAAVEAERDRMKAALEFYANPFGRLDSNGERATVPDFYAEMEFGGIARAALTPQGQSTDGETR